MATNNQTPPPSGPNMSLGDIYYVLFKHKWLILLCSAAGLGVAAYMYLSMAPMYVSEAKLLVRYVPEDKGPLQGEEIHQLAGRADDIIAAEAEILRSLDVAGEVVDAVGAQRILGKDTISTNREYAAQALLKNLEVELAKKGNVLSIRYRNPDPNVVQPVLKQALEIYYKRHVRIHKSLGVFDDFLTQQTDQWRAQLTTTEEELRRLKTAAEVDSLEDARRNFSEERSKLREEMRQAEIELAERRAALEALEGTRTLSDGLTNATAVTATNATAVASGAEQKKAAEDVATPSAAVAAKTKPSQDVLDEYVRLKGSLENYYRTEQGLLTQFTPESALVKEVRMQITRVQAQKKKMEEENPGLTREEEVLTARATGSVVGMDKSALIEQEKVRVLALSARIAELNVQWEKLRKQAAKIEEVDPKLSELQRKKEQQEDQYKTAAKSLQQAQLEAALNSGKISNISPIQEPSPPVRESSQRIKKVSMAAGVGIGLGLAIAFGFEFLLNQTVRKPGEVSSMLRLPIFVNIPEFRNGKRRKLGWGKKRNGKMPANGEATDGETGLELAKVEADMDMAPWHEQHELHPFAEALRDRLVTFFEVKKMTQKPKLIALTACSSQAGVTSVAAALAASLSETGEGNVLLVDMNSEQGAAHPFYKGKPACGLEDVLSVEKRGEAKINDKLYMVTGGVEGENHLPRILPKRFAGLLPKLQASDYDYIIFDMPPITQTSVTPRLASLMDVTLLMVEAGKTNREALRHANSLLAETKTNLGIIFNRRRNFVPRWLHQEY